MEIDISRFFATAEAADFSASILERGEHAARDTWNNARKEAAESPILTTEDQLQALRDHVQAMGFGDEVQGYGADECNALMVQLVSGDMREGGIDAGSNDDDWSNYQERAEAGEVAGNMFKAADGRVFYTLEG